MAIWKFAIAAVLALACGCAQNDRPSQPSQRESSQKQVRDQVSAKKAPPIRGEVAKKSPPIRVQRSAKTVIASPDLLAEALAMNTADRLEPKPNFQEGNVSPLDADDVEIVTGKHGFTIQMPSRTPISTPTVYRGRLYVSGGFSSEEYYCFDAKTGAFIWGAQVSDDGPSSAVPYDDSIIFSTESCTLFALDADSGAKRWAWYLGDPMMAAPTVSGDLVFAVYPGGARIESANMGVFKDTDKKSEQEAETTNPNRPPEVPSPGANVAAPIASAPDTKSEIESSGSLAAAGPALQPTYVLACFEPRTGKLIWRRWVDGDSISAPVAADNDLYVATFPGTLYHFRASDGAILAAHGIRATSAPVVTSDSLKLTCRIDDRSVKAAPVETVVSMRRADAAVEFVAAGKTAPYLDRIIQQASDATDAADAMEAGNGIGGGFGSGGGSGGGFFAIQDGSQDESSSEHSETQDSNEVAPFQASDAQPAAADQHLDPLASQQRLAADNIGLGNVSTLQGFQGSRLLHANTLNFSCMGDELVCISAESGAKAWGLKLDGDLNKLGGHLAAPPIAAGKQLIVATLTGEVLQIDRTKGAVLARHKIGSAVRYAPVVDNGRIYVGTQDGKVICIDTEDPSIDGWPMWGGNPGHTGVAMPAK